MSKAAAILVADDDADVLRAVQLALTPHATRIDTAGSVAALQEALERGPYEAVLLDMNFAIGDHTGREGLRGLEAVHARDPAVAVVLMTAYGGVALAVEALKRGAVDFVLKPWRNEKLVEAITAACAQTRARRAGEALDLDVIERRTIQQALTRFEGNISQAAAALGLTRPALYRRMAKHGL